MQKYQSQKTILQLTTNPLPHNHRSMPNRINPLKLKPLNITTIKYVKHPKI